MNQYLLLDKSSFSSYKICFILILAVFTLITVLYSLYAPAFEGPDEQFHYGYAKDIFYGEFGEKQYLRKAPLSYFINAGILHLVQPPQEVEIKTNPLFPHDKNRFKHGTEEEFPFSGTSYSVHFLRLFNVLVGLATVVFIFKTSKLVFSNKILSLFSTSFVAFIPKFAWMNSVINNDALVYLFGTISIFFLIKYTNDKKMKFSLLLGLFVGLAILSKSNALVLHLVVITIFSYLILTNKMEKLIALKHYIGFLVVSVFSGGWYTIQKLITTFDINNIHFNSVASMLTAAHKVDKIQRLTIDEMFMRITNLDLLHYRMVDMLWSNLGWHVIKLPQYVGYIAEIFLLISVVGLAFMLLKLKSPSNLTFDKNHLIILFSSVIFMGSLMILYVSRGGSGDIRYTFPVIVAFGILFSIGFSRVFYKKKLKYIMILPIALLILMNVQLLAEMNENFAHGFGGEKYKECNMSSKYEQISDLLEVFCTRGDLVKAFPEVYNGDTSRLTTWAYKFGYKERESLNEHRPFYLMMHVYYKEAGLQQRFPEANNTGNIQNLLTWVVDEGIYDKPVLEKNSDYYKTLLNETKSTLDSNSQIKK